MYSVLCVLCMHWVPVFNWDWAHFISAEEKKKEQNVLIGFYRFQRAEGNLLFLLAVHVVHLLLHSLWVLDLLWVLDSRLILEVREGQHVQEDPWNQMNKSSISRCKNRDKTWYMAENLLSSLCFCDTFHLYTVKSPALTEALGVFCTYMRSIWSRISFCSLTALKATPAKHRLSFIHIQNKDIEQEIHKRFCLFFKSGKILKLLTWWKWLVFVCVWCVTLCYSLHLPLVLQLQDFLQARGVLSFPFSPEDRVDPEPLFDPRPLKHQDVPTTGSHAAVWMKTS